MPLVIPLVALDILVLALWTIAVALAIALIMDKLGSILNGVPVVGGYLAGVVQSMARAISNAAGTLEGGIDHLIGGAWHALSRYIDKLFGQMVAHSAIVAHFAQVIGSGVYSVSGLRSLVRSVSHVAHAAYAGIRTLEREWHGIEHRVRVIERDLARGIGNDVRSGVRGLERQLHGIERGVIPDLRAGIQAAEGEVTQLERFLKALPGTRYLDWAAGIVAAALGVGLLDFFRCPTFLSKTLGRGCGFWNTLEDLLGLFADAILFADLCQLTAWINEIFGPIEGFIVGLISDAANAACAQPPSSFVYPAATFGQLPPSQSIGTLP